MLSVKVFSDTKALNAELNTFLNKLNSSHLERFIMSGNDIFVTLNQLVNPRLVSGSFSNYITFCNLNTCIEFKCGSNGWHNLILIFEDNWGTSEVNLQFNSSWLIENGLEFGEYIT